MCRFLCYVVDQKLRDPSGRTKEAVIGVQVFDKDPSYDPRLDPIVRVEARRLRSKLQEYYEGPGAEDAVQIDLPKGSYAAVFQPRKPQPLQLVARASNTIAVLPFANLSPESDEYFSDGLTEELIHALTKIEGLRVVAWNSAVQLKGREDEIGRIREQLKVEHALRGSVRKTGERLRITAQLIDTGSGVYLWSETYDRLVTDVFAIQEEIARAIVTALKLHLATPDLVRREPSDLDYYNLYLKGRFHWNQRTQEGLERSILYFEQAAALDGNCALAYTGLADAYSLLTDYGLKEPQESMPRAKAAAERALEADPDSAEACTSLGLIQSHFEWRWPEAETLYRRAIRLKPAYQTAHHWYAIDFLAMLGRQDEAREEIAIARVLDPLSPIIAEGPGFLSMLERKYETAIEEHRQVLALDAGFYKAFTSIGRAYIQLGRYDNALEMLRTGRKLAGDVPNILSALGQAHALAGNVTEARNLLVELHSLAEHRYVPGTCFAIIHIGLGEPDQALDWLERAADRRQSPLAALYVHPVYDPLRGNPRYHALVDRIGFRRVLP
jgi:TolB-like protein/Flp pilus assembly protein TadD